MGYFSDKATERNENVNLSGLDKTVCYECI